MVNSDSMGWKLPADLFVSKTIDPKVKNWEGFHFLEIQISGFTNYESDNTGPAFPPGKKLRESILVHFHSRHHSLLSR